MQGQTIARWVLAVVMVVTIAGGSSAATIVVNSIGDTAADDGQCTLREAIIASVTDTATGSISGECGSGDPGLDTVNFNINFGIPGPFVIALTAPLPIITQPTFFDGYSQRGARPNSLRNGSDAVLMIEVRGDRVPADCDVDLGDPNAVNRPRSPIPGTGFHFVGAGADGSRLRGLAIGGFDSSHPAAVMLFRVSGVQIDGNFIGLDADGSPRPNGRAGVWVLNGDFESVYPKSEGNMLFVFGTAGNLIGGSTPAERNVISANDVGVFLGGQNNRVEGNYVGVDPGGVTSIPNREHGVIAGVTALAAATVCPDAKDRRGYMFTGDGNAIGGPGRRGNFFSAEADDCAVTLRTSFNRVEGNWMGTDNRGGPGPSGFGLAAQPGCGVQIQREAVRNRVAFNTMAYNSKGIVVTENTLANDLHANSVHSNVGAGIDLENDGVTANDPDDFDTGANDLQNFPEALAATPGGVVGRLQAKPEREYRLDFYANGRCRPQDAAEGTRFAGSTSVLTDAKGHAAFSASVLGLKVEQFVTASATSTADGTSELSECAVVKSGLSARVEVRSSRNPVRAREAYDLTVLVHGNGVTPSGSVTLRDLNHPFPYASGLAYRIVGSGTLAPSATVPGTAELVVSSAKLSLQGWGNRRLQAEFGGDATYMPSVSPDFVQAVYRGKSDLDGDGFTDLVLCDPANEKFLVQGQAFPKFGGPVALPQLDAGRRLLGVGELGLFGQPAVLWRDAMGDVGGTTFAGGLPDADFGVPLAPGLEVVGLGSLYGDLKDDLVVHDANGQTSGVLTSDLKGGQLQLYAPWDVGAPSPLRVRHTGDFNGDGNLDWLLADGTNPAVLWLLDGALRVIGMGTPSDVPSGGAVVAVGDFNGDGRSDIVWRLANNNHEIALQDGPLTVQKATLPFGTTGQTIVGTAHFDIGAGSSNGRSSLVVRDASGQLEAWINTAISGGVPVFGAVHALPTNGRTDLTVCVP